MVRLIKGMLIAPLVAALSWAAIASAVVVASGEPWAGLGQFGQLVALTSIYAYPIGWVLGLVALGIYRRLGLSSLRSYVLGGLVVGTAIGPFLIAVPDSSESIPPL